MSADIDRHNELQAYEQGRAGAVLLDANLAILGVSQGTLAISGHEGGSLIGRSALDVVHPDDLERAGEALVEAMAVAGASAEGMYRLRFADSTYHEFGVTAICLGEERDNETIFQFGAVPEQLRAGEFARDTVDTLRMLAESHELHEYLERVHQLAERHMLGSALAITTYDPTGALQTHRRDPEARTFSSATAEPDLPVHVERALEDHLRGPWRSFHRMALYEQVDGASRVTSVLTDDDNAVLGYVEAHQRRDEEPGEHEWMVHGLIRQVLTVVVRRVQLDRQLRRAADLDPLTGLANRRRLFRDMNATSSLHDSWVLLLDLDRFSWINNTLGHHVGDQALVDLAETLATVCPAEATIARFGGDEFVIWAAPGSIDPERLCKEIRTMQQQQPADADQRAVVRCSVGAVTVRAGESPNDAIKRADEAMYIAKRRGGDCLHIAS